MRAGATKTEANFQIMEIRKQLQAGKMKPINGARVLKISSPPGAHEFPWTQGFPVYSSPNGEDENAPWVIYVPENTEDYWKAVQRRPDNRDGDNKRGGRWLVYDIKIEPAIVNLNLTKIEAAMWNNSIADGQSQVLKSIGMDYWAEDEETGQVVQLRKGVQDVLKDVTPAPAPETPVKSTKGAKE